MESWSRCVPLRCCDANGVSLPGAVSGDPAARRQGAEELHEGTTRSPSSHIHRRSISSWRTFVSAGVFPEGQTVGPDTGCSPAPTEGAKQEVVEPSQHKNSRNLV